LEDGDHRIRKTLLEENSNELKDQQLRHREESERMSSHRETHDALLAGMITYSEECDEHHGNGKEHHEGLKVERLAVLAEAITG
jgi:hypothetical protein